jgi:uncharacterized protein YpmB
MRSRSNGKKDRISLVLPAAIGILASIAAAFCFFFWSVHDQEWSRRSMAAEAVTASTYMTNVERVETFVGDKTYSIVFGKDGEGKDAIAWVDLEEETVHLEYAANGISEAEAREKVKAAHPESEILRATPGVWDGVYLWEVFYRLKEEDGSRYYYDYYRFTDGEKIDTWRLVHIK